MDSTLGLHQYRATALTDLARHLIDRWQQPGPGVFDFDLAVTGSAGVRRWLTQRLADGPEGICAGVRFETWSSFERLLRGGEADPWAPDAALWLVRPVVDRATADPALDRLRDHLATTGDPYSLGKRITSRFAAYARWRRPMIAAWLAGDDVDAAGNPLGDNAWQAHLWRMLCDEIGIDPLSAHQQRCEVIAAGPNPAVPRRVAIFAPSAIAPTRLEILDALASNHQVDLLVLDTVPGRTPPAPTQPIRRDWRSGYQHRLNRALGKASEQLLSGLPQASQPVAIPDRADHLLGWLQADLLADRSPAQRTLAEADKSVQIHLSHGLDRQVEVLRDVLARMLQDDPSLEPREVVVLTPDPDRAAPLLSAAFGPVSTEPPQHPGHQFRVQVAQRTVAQVNPLVSLLLDLLEMGSTRITRSALLDFAALPMVARRFGLTGDRHDRLTVLVERSGVRWGLHRRQRERYQLEFEQSTWMAGLQRLVLGVALSEDDLVTAGRTVPVDDVDSSDVEMIGGLAELVSRISRLVDSFGDPADLKQWIARCQDAVGQLVALEPDEQGWLTELTSGLRRLGEDAGGGALTIPPRSARRMLRDYFHSKPARATYGNGSLVVTGLEPLRAVPHRVVCLLGWDAETYPARPSRPADDLLAAQPWVGDPDPALAGRQALLDAIHAATEKLVIVCAHRDPITNAEVPLAAPIAELTEALEATARTKDGRPVLEEISQVHHLQPFHPDYFNGRDPRSFDLVALACARASQDPAEGTEIAKVFDLPPLVEDSLSLADLISFLKHPTKQLVKRRSGVTLDDPEQTSEQLPIELDHLQRWSIGSRSLRRAMIGHSRDQIRQAELGRGELPPGDIGIREMEAVLRDVGRVFDQIPGDAGPVQTRSLQLDINGIRLLGQVETRGNTLLNTWYSKLSAKVRLESWVQLLALAAAEPGDWRGLAVTRSRLGVWRAPVQAEANRLLGQLLDIYQRGMSEPLPMPVEVAEAWASLRARRVDPDSSSGNWSLRAAWEHDKDQYWELCFGDLAGLREVARNDQWGPDEEQSALGSLARTLWDPLLAHQEGR